MKLSFLYLLTVLLCLTSVPALAAPPSSTPTMGFVEQSAFQYFWDQSDPATGLTHDRAHNTGRGLVSNTVASTAATGYALAALPVAVSHGWVSRALAYGRALSTLRFIARQLPCEHGFYPHFVDPKTGARAWNSEFSSIDTALLLLGARLAGDYWPRTEAARLADVITERADWTWMETNGGQHPEETTPSMGWTPESGFLASRWQGYSEALFLYVLALGSRTHPLPPTAWNSWQISSAPLEGFRPVFGGAQPLFMAQMSAGYLDLRGLRDRQGRDWWAAWRNAHWADQAYCRRNPAHVQTYAEGFWGLSANDLPPSAGYGVNRPADGMNDGTVSPSAMLAAVISTPDAANAALRLLWRLHGPQLWGAMASQTPSISIRIGMTRT